MRDVDLSPDGSFFVVSTTGGYRGNTGPCDSTMRWETRATGSTITPTWADYTGGDTTYAVAVTGAAVYVGGHMRWENNPLASDSAGAGAVAREGLAALDPANGLPLTWNPGRERGVGVFDILATPTGIWVGSDTDRIGNYEYHGRIAFFPLAGGATPAPYATGSLPGHVFLTGATAPTGPTPTGTGSVLYRVNAGGPTLKSVDAGPAWDSDSSFASKYRNLGNLTEQWAAVGSVDRSVPASTPSDLFSTDRYDPAGLTEMSWAFPVPRGTAVQVRLYFASRCSCTATAGSRLFSVSLDGQSVLPNFDIVAAAGQNVGTMRSFDVTSDGTVDIGFTHAKSDPVVSGIEIVRAAAPVPPSAGADDLRDVYDDGVKAAPASVVPGTGIAWSTSRGSVMIDGDVYTGYSDGSFTRRSFDGTTFGPATAVDGADQIVPVTSWHTDVTRITGMFFDKGRLYYTLSGDPTLYDRYFTPQSDVVGALRFSAGTGVTGVDFSTVAGMFATGGKLYFASSADGTLHRVDWSNGAPVAGTAVVVGGPQVDGTDWRSRGMFLYTGHNLPGGVNQAPTAVAAVSCSDLSCTADGTGSSDVDGSIAAYSWDFGDGTTAGGAKATHTYAQAGDHTVTLTVTDNEGATGSAGRTVSVSAPPPPAPAPSVAYVGSSAVNVNASSVRVPVPAGVAPGDSLLLFVSTASNVTPAAPDNGTGWSVVGTQGMGGTNGLTTVWRRIATAGDAGRTLTVTLSDITKAAATLVAYTGTSTSEPVAAVQTAAESVSRADHTTPAVDVASAGSVVVSYWADRSSATAAWTPPAGETDRGQTAGTGGGHIASLLTDSGTAVPVGPRAGRTATADSASSRATMFSVVLAVRS
jgi:PKD repeat protein